VSPAVLGLLVACGVVGALAASSAAAALGAAALGVVVVLARFRPAVAAVVVVGLCPALSGISRELGVGPLKISEALLLVGAAVALLHRPVSGQGVRAADIGLLAYAGLACFFAAVHTLGGDSSISSFVRIGLAPTLLLLTYWTCSRTVRDRADLVLVLRWLLLVSVLPSVLAVGQGFDLPGVRSLLLSLTDGLSLAAPGDPGVARVTSIFPDWHTFAAYLLIPTALPVMLLLRGRRDVLPLPWLLTVLAVNSAALLLTVTATVAAWAVVAIVLLGWRRRQLAQSVAVLGTAVLVGGLLFSGPIASRVAEQRVTTVLVENPTIPDFLPQTLNYRLSIWQRDYLPLLDEALPYGISNELPESVLFAHSENAYITLTLRGGLLLLGAAAAAMVLLGRELARGGRRSDLESGVNDVLLSVLLFLPFATMIWPYFTNSGFPQTFFALAGAAAGAEAARRRQLATAGRRATAALTT
jgi:hypothetical protein